MKNFGTFFAVFYFCWEHVASLSSVVPSPPASTSIGPPVDLLQDAYAPSSHVRYDAFEEPREIWVEKISNGPPMFVLRNFVSEMERHTLMFSARNHPKNPLAYEKDSNRNGSNVCWMPHHDRVSKSLASAAADLLLEHQGRNIANEELQVVRYSPNGHFNLHHDQHERILTVLYYLNGVAGTWFPFATDTLQPQNKREAMELAQSRTPGLDGILVHSAHNHPNQNNYLSPANTVPIEAGDALVFYSYKKENQQNEHSMFQDWQSFHAGLPAEQEKWIATHWFHPK